MPLGGSNFTLFSWSQQIKMSVLSGPILGIGLMLQHSTHLNPALLEIGPFGLLFSAKLA